MCGRYAFIKLLPTASFEIFTKQNCGNHGVKAAKESRLKKERDGDLVDYSLCPII